MGVSQNEGYLDCSILGSVSGSPYLGETII